MIRFFSRNILFVLFIFGATLIFGQESSVTITEKNFLDYSEKVIEEIGNHNPLVTDYLDTLTLYEKSINTEFSIGVLNRVFGSYHIFITGDNEKALEFFHLASTTLKDCCYHHAQTARSLLGENHVLINSGLYNFDTTFFLKGKEIMEEALMISTLIDETELIVRSLDYFGDYYYYTAFKAMNMDSALYYYKKAEKVIETGDVIPYLKADNFLGLANVYRAIGNKEEENYYFQKSKEVCEQNNNFSTLYALYNDYAEQFDSTGNYQEALKNKLIAYEYVKKSKNIEFQNRADRQMYSTYKDLGDFENALLYYEKYNSSLEEMHKDKALKFQSALETKRDISLKEEEILKLEIRNSKTKGNYLLLLASFALITLLLSLWTNIILKRKNKALSQKNKEIILARLKGQNTERKRMAGELHDNLNTKIAAVRWQLEAIQDTVKDQEKAIVQNLVLQLNDVYEDVRLISHNLMPETVETIGLIQAINDLISKLNESDKVKFNLVTDLEMDENFNALSYPVYNIIFEMINNVLKHSEAENAWISISRNQKGDLKLSVSDDGKGFDVDQMKNGYGIKSIISRIENLNGQWSIESTPGNGTKIYVEVPNL